MPATPEVRVRAIVSTMNSLRMNPRRAPIARMVPISAVRSKTDMTSEFIVRMTTIPPTMNRPT